MPNLKPPVNTSQKSPSESLSAFAGKNFWKPTLDNDDFIHMYKRGGIAFRVFNKEKNLLFKNGFTLNNENAQKVIDELNISEIVKYARLNAQISGFCPVYMDFGDVNSDPDYMRPADSNAIAQSFFVIPVAWLERDIYYNNQSYDHYVVYRADGSTFNIHKSRIYRAKIDPNEISKLEPAYNSLQVIDNTLWGVGQTMFRTGTGFPVLSIENADELIDYQGTKITRAKYYKKIGFFKDMSTEVGFIKDKRDEFDFVGAEGKAIKPLEYWDIALQAAAITLDTPVDILKGVSAGAVTGSETNLREYFSDLNGKQQTELEPIYNDLLEHVGIDISELEYQWNPIWEMTPQEITDTFSKDIIAFNNAENAGYITHEQVINYLAEQYPEMGYDELTNRDIPRPQPVVSLNAQKEQPSDIHHNPDGEISKITSPTIPLPRHLDISQIQKQYDKSDVEIKKSLDKADAEPSSLPESVQKVVNLFRKELLDTYSDTQQNVESLLVGFNTDSRGRNAKTSRV